MTKCQPKGVLLAESRHIDSKKIEKAAVKTISDLIQPCEVIDDKLDTDDKNILVDGTFELYHSSELTKENLAGEITVQIKGTTRKLRPNRRGFIKYKVEIESLRRYSDVFHGILFFCVAVDKNSLLGKDVYFAQLLPYDINRVLAKTKSGQKEVSVSLKLFPEDSHEIIRLISAFNENRERQLKAKVSGYGFLNENQELPPDIKSLSFSTQLFPGEDITTIAGLSNAYVYGEDKRGQLVVFGKFENVAIFAIGTKAVVSSGDFEMETLLYVGDHIDGKYLEFEGISMLLGKEQKATLNFTVSGGFRRRYNTVRFVQEFIRSGEMSINSNVIFRVYVEDNNRQLKQNIGEIVKVYEPFVNTLDALNIGIDWDPSKMTSRELNDIGLMHRLIVEKKPLTDRTIDSPIVHFNIQGAQVYALARKHEGGGYEFVDLLSEELFFVLGWKDERATDQDLGFDPVPAVVTIGKRGFRCIANLNPDRFAAQLERFPVTIGNQTQLNITLLEMLTAYDEGAKQSEALLACAVALARKLYEFDGDSKIYLLNLLQTIKRKRNLQAEEKDLLRDIALDGKQLYTKAAAYVLLDDKKLANKCLIRCTKQERKQIEDYPISRFFA